jgi:choline-sulfatase
MRVNCPLCAPSRAGLATARRYHRAGVRNNDDELDPDLPNFFRNLRESGYQVFTTGKSDLHTVSEHFDPSGWHPHLEDLGFTNGCDYAGKWRGVNFMRTGRPDAYCAFLRKKGLDAAYLRDMSARYHQRHDNATGKLSTKPSALPTEACTDDYCGMRSVDLLRSAEPNKPWCMWVSFPGPHEPFDPPEEFQRRYRSVTFPGPVDPDRGDGEDHQGIRRNYAGMISHIDHWIGELVTTIDRRGELDNTVIVFVSDHGELLGDHGKWYKRSSYEGSVHVPLIVAGPGIPEGRECDSLVELIDIGPTLLACAKADPLPDVDGKSINRLFSNPDLPHRGFTISACDNWRMVFDGRFKLTEWEDGGITLWDLEHDPEESADLSRDPRHASIRDTLLKILRAESPWVTWPPPVPTGPEGGRAALPAPP